MIGIVADSVLGDLVIEVVKEPPSLKEISGLAKIALGSIQVFLGTAVFPLQLCGRVFRHNKPLLISQGITNLKKLAGTIQGVAKSIFGILQIVFGVAVLPFQLCGRLFKSTQPLLFREGIKNILRGVKTTHFRMKSLVFNCF